jgi:hypothetical protein
MPKYKMGKDANVITNEGGSASGKKKKTIGGGRSISNLLGIKDPSKGKIKGGKKLLKQYGNALKAIKTAPRARGGR